LYCGGRPAVVRIKIPHPFTGQVFDMQNVWVEVRDNNGIWPHKIMASGYANSSGSFYYSLPNCDDDPGQNNPPDTYFVVQTRDVYGKFVNEFLGRYHAVASGTNWEDTSLDRTFTINASSDTSTQGFWVLRALQFGADFNSLAGGVGSGQIPIKVYWPGSFVPSNSAYSPVGRIVLGGSLWFSTGTINHELGHNIKYFVGNYGGYVNCYSAVYVCDPMFAPDITQYQHSLTQDLSPPIAVNEGFAHLLSVMETDHFSLPQEYDSRLKRCHVGEFCFNVGTGAGYEARVATFFYLYVRDYLARLPGMTMTSAYGKLRESLRDTITFNQDFYSLWNSFAYRSFYDNSTAMGIPTYCPQSTSSVAASIGYPRAIVQCIQNVTTLTASSLVLP
jgi:hypothetical protein